MKEFIRYSLGVAVVVAIGIMLRTSSTASVTMSAMAINSTGNSTVPMITKGGQLVFVHPSAKSGNSTISNNIVAHCVSETVDYSCSSKRKTWAKRVSVKYRKGYLRRIA